MDKIYVYLKKKNNGVGQPEYRVPSMILGSVLLPIGLLISGWAADQKWSWVVTDVVSEIQLALLIFFENRGAYL